MTRPPRHLPCLEQFLALPVVGVADGTGDAVEQGLARKAVALAIGQAVAGGAVHAVSGGLGDLGRLTGCVP